MHLLASSTKQRLQCCLLAVRYDMASNQLLCGLFPSPLYHACASHWLLSKDSWFTHYICHVEMQLNDVIKSIAFVALPILIRYHQNSIETDTGIDIGASLVCNTRPSATSEGQNTRPTTLYCNRSRLHWSPLCPSQQYYEE